MNKADNPINAKGRQDPEPEGSPCAVYYNSACPVCNSGIEYQKGRMASCNVAWKDVHRDTTAVDKLDGDIEFIRKRLHVVERSGNVCVGIDAFIALWRISPGEAWKAELLSLPVVHGFAACIYNAFAVMLYHYNRWAKHW